MTRSRKFNDDAVKAVFDSKSPDVRSYLLEIRELIFDVADSSNVIGVLEESLKWGEPSYAPKRPRIGSPVRLDSFGPQEVALYFNCNTLLVENFRGKFGDVLRYSGNRAVVLCVTETLPTRELRACIEDALTYHLRKRRRPN